MKLSRFLAITLVGAAAIAGSMAQARGHHHGGGFGFYFGAPYYGPSYYRYSPFYSYPYPSYPYYYSPQTIVTVPATPPTYIQQSQPATTQNPSGYWYYCDNPEGYYPYVKECLNSWQAVEPTPPPTR